MSFELGNCNPIMHLSHMYLRSQLDTSKLLYNCLLVNNSVLVLDAKFEMKWSHSRNKVTINAIIIECMK